MAEARKIAGEVRRDQHLQQERKLIQMNSIRDVQVASDPVVSSLGNGSFRVHFEILVSGKNAFGGALNAKATATVEVTKAESALTRKALTFGALTKVSP